MVLLGAEQLQGWWREAEAEPEGETMVLVITVEDRIENLESWTL